MVKINMSPEFKKLAEEQGIELNQVKEVVEHGEMTGEKLVLGNKSMAKKRIGTTTIYVIYESKDDAFEPVSTYFHRMEEKEVTDFVMDDVQEWVCPKCNEKTVRASMYVAYMGVTRQAPVIACPKCKQGFFEDYVVNKTLCTAMTLFEKKRA